MSTNFLVFVFLLAAKSVLSDPIIIKSGIARDHSQHHGGDVYDLSSKKGLASYEADHGFNKDNEKKYVGAQDFGKYGQELADKKHHLDEKNFANENFRKQTGGGLENVDNNESHKKGHQKSGFHNTYHKDESGSKSSYYDDSNDEGGQHFQNNREGAYGDLGSNRNQGTYSDGSRYSKDDTKYGGYDNEGLYEKDFGNRRNYDQEKYYDDRALQGNSNAGNQYGEAGRYVEERYHKPYYVHERPFYPQSQQHYETRRFPSRKTITVYEDPRVYDRNMEYSRYEDYPQYNRYDDDIHLDVRRPMLPNYYNDRSNYDDDYYRY